MDVAQETTIRMLREALLQAKLATWRSDLDPASRIVELRRQLNLPFATMSNEVAEAARIVRPAILETFEQCCASGDPVAALDKFIGVIEEQLIKVQGAEPGSR